MRTIKRYSYKVNNGEWNQLCEIARLYRDEKNFHLKIYNQDKNYCNCQNERSRRDALVKEKYQPSTNLQARQWKTALTEAHDAVDKNWCALAVEIKSLIAKHKGTWSDAEMHYAYWLTYKGKRLAELMGSEKAPEPDHFEISHAEKKRGRNYLRRVIRRKRGGRPIARLTRSFALDANMYSLVEKVDFNGEKVQFIKIMGLTPRKMIVVPLTGYSNFSGNIRIVLDFYRHRIEVHTTSDVTIGIIPEQGGVVALDAGCSEVFTDENSTAYEPAFGKTLLTASEKLCETMKARNKSAALMKKSSKHKAHRILKFNLGKQKMRDRKRKIRIRVKQQISHAIRQVCHDRKPSIVVTENLDIRGKAKNKKMSRLVSFWMRSSLKERLEFLALVESFHHKQVNPAYTSQMCPTCLFVHKDNRKGDIFQCLNCGHTDLADRVAAINLKARYYDPNITIYTPKSVVWSILQKRFIASLESSNSTIVGATVSGRTGAQCKVRQSETPLPNSNNGRGTEMSYLMTF